MRRFLSHAFSQRSLSEQESLIADVIDKFVEQLDGKARDGTAIDLSKWFIMMTFDIIGELAFGESFQGIETGILSVMSVGQDQY
jgi:cytochrome P450